MNVSVIIPTFNEAPNVAELVARIEAATLGLDAEVIFVDDSNDDTPDVIVEVARESVVPVRLIHRAEPVGGLSGAVIEGMTASTRDWCLVMDGDLQHPPELIPILVASGEESSADVVVASRHTKGGSNGGLDNWVRKLVSNSTTALTRSMFPIRLRNCTDPMTGFFAVRRSSVDVAKLRPRGFKILLEILARQPLRVVEEPFIFGARMAGSSKANLKQGFRFAHQLAALRFGRMSMFAVIGGFGAILNLAIMAALLSTGTYYIAAAAIAAAITILSNFFLQEWLVFRDLRNEGRSFWTRFAQAVGFNGAETLVRLPLIYLIVEYTPVPSLLASAITLAVSFVVRFTFQSRVVYRPRRTTEVSPSLTSGEPRASAEYETPTAEK